MKKIAFSLVAAVALGACSTPDKPTGEAPIVASFNGDSVQIIQPLYASYTMEEVKTEANRVCQRSSGKIAEYASQRSLGYQGNMLMFLCLNPGSELFSEKREGPPVSPKDRAYFD